MSAWDRQPGESGRGWAHFVVYRDLGPRRSLRQAAVRIGVSEAVLERHSANRNWVARCAAWDDEQDRIRRAQIKKEIERETKANLLASRALRQKGLERISHLTLAEMSAADAIRALDAASKISRGALGAPDQHVKVDAEVKHELTDPRGELARLLDRLATRGGAGGGAGEPQAGGS